MQQTFNDSGMQKLLTLNHPNEYVKFIDNNLFLYFPDGIGKAKINNNYIEKLLNTPCTTRNWNTILKMVELGLSVL